MLQAWELQVNRRPTGPTMGHLRMQKTPRALDRARRAFAALKEPERRQILLEFGTCTCADLARTASRHPAMAVGAALGAVAGVIFGSSRVRSWPSSVKVIAEHAACFALDDYRVMCRCGARPPAGVDADAWIVRHVAAAREIL